jgi:hypothetical protein
LGPDALSANHAAVTNPITATEQISKCPRSVGGRPRGLFDVVLIVLVCGTVESVRC